jgi:hypothetical protein
MRNDTTTLDPMAALVSRWHRLDVASAATETDFDHLQAAPASIENALAHVRARMPG